ncbi:MAG: molybdenum cofactor guanylyltransferase [Thermodesulfobacteriota bacterium]
MKENTTGIILCGGKNTRMKGKNKAFLEKDGKTFIEIIYKNLIQTTKEIIIVSNEPEKFTEKGFKACRDIIKKNTPLSGIHSGLVNMNTDFGFVLACDMPFIKKEVLCFIAEKADYSSDVVTPCENTYFQPLCSVYSKKCIPFIETLLQKGEVKTDKLFKLINLKTIPYDNLRKFDPKLKSFININSKKDFETFSDY